MQQQLMFENKPEKLILSITGHRPNRLGGYKESVFSELILFAIVQIQKIKPTEVNIGMALGWDQAVAKACIACGIPYHAHVVRAQQSIWNSWQKGRYEELMSLAVSKTYHGDANSEGYMARNRAMVDSGNSILALWDGSTDSGTSATVRYAKSKDKHIINCWEDWQRWLQ